MKKMDFNAAHAMVEDMMHSTNAPFVCLLKMGNLSSMMCNNVLLTDVLVTLMVHAWDSMRKHENGPSASAKAILAAALGCLEKEKARLSDEDAENMIRDIQSMTEASASLGEVVQQEHRLTAEDEESVLIAMAAAENSFAYCGEQKEEESK